MRSAVFYALYLPSRSKIYTLEQVLRRMRKYHLDADIYIGIQANSIPQTESIINNDKRRLRIWAQRVPQTMLIDSDASSFVAALELYYRHNPGYTYDLCYFAHSKGVTSGDDDTRRDLFKWIFEEDLRRYFMDPGTGSYGPFLTVTDVTADIEKMSCMRLFCDRLIYEPMHYYYIHTFFVIRGHIVKTFLENVSPRLFKTPISEYSDRWMMERDFFHIADMLGYLPSYKYLHGNYSTDFVSPTVQMVEEKKKLYISAKAKYDSDHSAGGAGNPKLA
jgi:hypothetical protein